LKGSRGFVPVPSDGLAQSDHAGSDQVVDIDVMAPSEQVIGDAPHEAGVHQK
jgi:hypothetical protein